MQVKQKLPKGWFISGSSPDQYSCTIDTKIVHSGKVSCALSATTEKPSGFITLMQDFRAKKFLGKRVRLAAFIKTEDLTGWAALWMRADGFGREQLVLDNMFHRKITGTTDWTHYEVVIDIPEEAHMIGFGALLSGNGKIWVDDVTFEEVTREVLTTVPTPVIPTEPINLNFEENE